MNFFRWLACFCLGQTAFAEPSQVVVHVKHYLNPEGLKYFEQCWFPLVHNLMSQYEGFILFEHTKTEGDSVLLLLKFKDEPTFDRWVNYPGHDDLVNALDPFRSRDYWEVKKEGEEWQIIPSKQTLKQENLCR